MENREIINETLVHLFHEIQKLEEEAIITEDFKDLTNNDMHIIEAVGLEGGNMSSIAAKLDITVGSLTTSMNSLVKKGYTERERSEKDRRIVYIHLTGKGRQAFHHHAKFHEQMTDAVMAELGEEEVQVLGKTLKALTDFFRSYKKLETKRLLQPGQNQKNLSGMQKPFSHENAWKNAIFLRRSSHRYPRAHTVHSAVSSAQYRPRVRAPQTGGRVSFLLPAAQFSRVPSPPSSDPCSHARARCGCTAGCSAYPSQSQAF